MIHSLLMALLIEAPVATPAPLAPAPSAVHHRNPISRIVRTTYECEDGKREFEIKYDQSGSSFEAGIRKGVPLAREQLAIATSGMNQLDVVSSIYPQCGLNSDTLLVFGRLGDSSAFVQLYWAGETLRTDTKAMVIK